MPSAYDTVDHLQSNGATVAMPYEEFGDTYHGFVPSTPRAAGWRSCRTSATSRLPTDVLGQRIILGPLDTDQLVTYRMRSSGRAAT